MTILNWCQPNIKQFIKNKFSILYFFRYTCNLLNYVCFITMFTQFTLTITIKIYYTVFFYNIFYTGHRSSPAIHGKHRRKCKHSKPEELYQEWHMHICCIPTTVIQLLLYSMGQPLTKALQPQTVSRTNIFDWSLNFLF